MRFSCLWRLAKTRFTVWMSQENNLPQRTHSAGRLNPTAVACKPCEKSRLIDCRQRFQWLQTQREASQQGLETATHSCFVCARWWMSSRSHFLFCSTRNSTSKMYFFQLQHSVQQVCFILCCGFFFFLQFLDYSAAPVLLSHVAASHLKTDAHLDFICVCFWMFFFLHSFFPPLPSFDRAKLNVLD